MPCRAVPLCLRRLLLPCRLPPASRCPEHHSLLGAGSWQDLALLGVGTPPGVCPRGSLSWGLPGGGGAALMAPWDGAGMLLVLDWHSGAPGDAGRCSHQPGCLL